MSSHSACVLACARCVVLQLRHGVRLSRSVAKEILVAFAAADTDRNSVVRLRELEATLHPVDDIHVELVRVTGCCGRGRGCGCCYGRGCGCDRGCGCCGALVGVTVH